MPVSSVKSGSIFWMASVVGCPSISTESCTPAIGWISDSLKASHGDEALRYAILSGTGFYVLATIFLLMAAVRLPKDWHGA